MKPPRIFARGKYFYTGHYLSGKPNEVERSTRIPLDIEPSDNPDWWKRSKHRAKLQSLLKDIAFEREAGARGLGYEKPKDVPTLDELLSEFNAANAIERDRARAPATLVHRRNAVDFLKRSVQKEWHILDRGAILELRRTAKAELAPATIRGYFTVLKMLFEFAVREEYIRSNPFHGVTVGVPQHTPKTVTLESEQALFRFLYDARKPMFDQVLFERLTGIRSQDVCGLKWSMFSDVLRYHNAKAHRDEEFPLSAPVRALLASIERRGEYVFAYRQRRTVSYYLQRAASFGAPKITTHQMKRSYLQEVARTEPDERTFQALAHHAATVNKVAVEHYSGRDMRLMLTALDRAQHHWLTFLDELFARKPVPGSYVFANKKH